MVPMTYEVVAYALTAVGTLAALLLGVPALVRGLPDSATATEAPGRLVRRGYLAALFVLVLGSISATAAYWAAASPLVRVGLAALAALSVAIFEIGCVALRSLRERHDGWPDDYRNQIYTSYVLLVAGVVSAALMLSPLSPWTIPFTAIGVLIGGAELYQRFEARLNRSPREWRLAHPGSEKERSTRRVPALLPRHGRPPAGPAPRSTPPDHPAER